MNGILVLNKPTGLTSHDCVNKIRRIFKTKKVGHLGTLDPDVTGVLPICINDATKIIPFINSGDKEYLATITIGYSTTTEDKSGEIIETDDSEKIITRAEITQILNTFLGKQTQIPPMYSAVKVNGKKLYEYAFKNETVERPEREIEIYNIELLSNEAVFSGKNLSFQIQVNCSKGTYIRTLAVDIGKKLGYPAHMERLVRTKSGKFTIDQSFTFAEIENGDYELVSMFDALQDYICILADDDIKRKISHGQKLKYPINQYQFTKVVFYDIFKQVLAVYERDVENKDMIKPIRVLKGE